MDGTYSVKMDKRGRLVVPAELRRRGGFEVGAPMILVDTPGGLVVMTREQLKSRVRADLHGLDLVGELLAERRSSSHERRVTAQQAAIGSPGELAASIAGGVARGQRNESWVVLADPEGNEFCLLSAR